MKYSFTPKQIGYLILAVVIGSFLLCITSISVIGYAKSGNDWVSATISCLGNVLGGIIGGLVAYLVAGYQVRTTMAIEHNKKAETAKLVLKLIKEELQSNSDTISTFIPYNSELGEMLRAQLSNQVWFSNCMYLQVPDDLLVKLNLCYRAISILMATDDNSISDETLNRVKTNLAGAISLISTRTKADN